MDFRLEAAAASEFAENVAEDSEFRVPKIDWDRTTREVLTLEWIDGLPLSDPDRLADAGFDPPKLGRVVIQSFLRQSFARRPVSRRHASGQSVRPIRRGASLRSISALWAGSV